MSIYESVIIALVVLEAVLTPCFIRAQWPQKTRTSLILKMICSTIFVLIAVVAMMGAGNVTAYAVLMVVGFILCWLGDFLLHVSPKEAFFLGGLASFLIGHVFFAAAYSSAVLYMFPQASFFDWREVLAFVTLFAVVMLVRQFTMNAKLSKKLLIPVLCYSGALLIMFVKACSLGIRCAAAGLPGGMALAILLCLGGALFVVSDGTLLYINFDGRKTLPLKTVNLVTYYGAQVLLAASILYVG